jgi:hypothetical protein
MDFYKLLKNYNYETEITFDPIIARQRFWIFSIEEICCGGGKRLPFKKESLQKRETVRYR